jgi:hypothetical protein
MDIIYSGFKNWSTVWRAGDCKTKAKTVQSTFLELKAFLESENNMVILNWAS